MNGFGVPGQVCKGLEAYMPRLEVEDKNFKFCYNSFVSDLELDGRAKDVDE